MRKLILLSAIVMFFSLTADTFAQGRRHRWRTRHGVRSGQLTSQEARLLSLRRRSLIQERRRYRSDGMITRSERLRLWRHRRAYDRLRRHERWDDDWNNRHLGRSVHRRGNGYYRRGAGSPTHPVFGTSNLRRSSRRHGHWRRHRS